ncbi:septal ring lytic transglycosylase RlpA family protein [Glycocaulis abyssi]|uniref:Endolytic peptidoglycan transglycosylase RlpA n=1 Tax=Glycocaulis abyssi TaxID=1433403 RepID=A0ABV9N651_9PROT
MSSSRISWLGVCAAMAGLMVAACSQTGEPARPAIAATPAAASPAHLVAIAGSTAPDPLTQAPRRSQTGLASWYGERFHGRLTASGEVYDMHALTAAHPDLPLRSLARVTRLDTGASVVVRINDRGPFVEGRIVDLSRAAAQVLNLIEDGLAEVRVEAFGPADPHDRAAVSGFLPRRNAASARGAAN